MDETRDAQTTFMAFSSHSPGARAGPFKGSVDAVGAGLNYTTMIDKMPLILNLRHYQEFNAENRWEGNSTLASATLRW
jgi:hypothetical protein